MLHKSKYMWVLLLICCGSLFSEEVAHAATFPDVTTYQEEIGFLTEAGVIRGYPDGFFRPSQSITRLQAVRMIMEDLKIPEGAAPPNPNFEDLKEGDYGYLEVARAVQLGIVSGTDYHVFNPQGKLTRAQMTKILTKAYDFSGKYPKRFSDVPHDSWALPYINSMASINVTIGYPDGTFKPNLPISRAHFAVFMARILNPSFKPESDQVADVSLQVLGDISLTDAIKHPTEPILYMINGKDNTLLSINYQTDEKVSVTLPYVAEKLAYANGKVYVTQVKKPHNSYTFDSEQVGAYAIYDAQSLVQYRLHHISLNPYDMVVDNQGIVTISGGSGQWTRIVNFDGFTGEQLSSQSIREKSIIQLNKEQNKLYTINTDNSSSFTTYNIENHVLQPGTNSGAEVDRYNKITHLDISGNGRFVFTSNGLVFSTNENEDMVSSGSLYRPFTSAAHSVESNEMFFANGNRLIQVYDSNTIEEKYQLATYGLIQHNFYDNQRNMLLVLSRVRVNNQTELKLGLEKIHLK